MMMNNTLAFLLGLFCFSLSNEVNGQNNCEQRYKSRVFNSIQIHRDVVFTKDAPSLLAASLGLETTVNQDLVMDVFMPPVTDTVNDRPVVIIGHGGGFINALFMQGTLLVGTKDNDDVQALADTLAHWGYVAACIQYRTGFDPNSSTSIKRAVWRGSQDMSAAIRFFRKNANWFGVDPARLFAAGSSAGAFCAIHSNFVDHNERIPESYQQNAFTDDLGPLHSRPIVELSAFNPFNGNNVPGDDVDSIAAGILAYWGAIADANMLSGNNHAPIRMFHGDSDPVVSPNCAKPFASVVLTAPDVCGSIIIDSVLNQLGLPHQTTIEPGQFHEYWGAVNGMWGLSGPDSSFWEPIIHESADFLYELMRPAAPLISGPTTVNAGNSIPYSIFNPNPSSTYCWNITGGSIISSPINAASIEVQFSNGLSNGTVTVQEIDAAEVASLPETLNININNPSSSFPSKAIEFDIFPQPASETLQIKWNQPLSGRIAIYNLQGQLMISRQLEHQNSMIIDDLTLSEGIYCLRISSKQGSISKKILIKQ